MTGMKDRVAVAGVGATAFGEHWDRDQYDLLAEAVRDAVDDAGIELADVEAFWLGNYYAFTGLGGTTVSDALRVYGKPVTRVENFCASGLDAFRHACMAVASGMHDLVVACGVEKITDQGTSGLPGHGRGDPVFERPSSPGFFALSASRAFHEWGWDNRDLAAVAVKNHANGAAHPKAHFRREITIEQALAAPEIASPLRRFDCAGVSDGAAAVVVARPEIARELRHKDTPVLVQSAQVAAFTYTPQFKPSFAFLGFPSTREAARRAYAEAGIEDPRGAVDIVECHDCFTITELLNVQDLGFCEPGKAAQLARDGQLNADGNLPVNPSGGLKAFGHPIGATGCRMVFEITRQLQGRALGRQVPEARVGVAHNVGGPGAVSAVAVLARQD